jgi:hypothetical protein
VYNEIVRLATIANCDLRDAGFTVEQNSRNENGFPKGFEARAAHIGQANTFPGIFFRAQSASLNGMCQAASEMTGQADHPTALQ